MMEWFQPSWFRHGRFLSKRHTTADISSRALSLRDIALVSRHWGLYNGAATVGACSHLEPEMALQRPSSHPWKERLSWHDQILCRPLIPQAVSWGMLPPSRAYAPRSATLSPSTLWEVSWSRRCCYRAKRAQAKDWLHGSSTTAARAHKARSSRSTVPPFRRPC